MASLEDLSVTGVFQGNVAGVDQEEVLGLINILRRQSAEDELSADHVWSAGRSDNGVKGEDFVKTVLRNTLDRDVGELAPDQNCDVVAVERSHRVFQPHTELPDHEVRLRQFLSVFVLSEMFVAKAPACVTDVPRPVGVLKDLGRGRIRQRRFVEGVGDDFSQRFANALVFKNTLDVEVEVPLVDRCRRCWDIFTHRL